MHGLVATKTAQGAGLLLEHGVHLSFIAFGVTGLVVLLLPQHLERFRRSEAVPRDAHERRVHELKAQLSTGTVHVLGSADSVDLDQAPTIDPAPRPSSPATAALEKHLLPLMLVAAVASASAHAAVAPPHLLGNPLFGAFFILCAFAQLAWVVTLASGTTRSMLQWAVVGNAAVLLLWATTRLWGLPFGLMPEPEAVGPWDVLCAIWELVIIAGALRLLREPIQGLRAPPLFDWTPAATAWLGSSGILILMLSVSGVHS